MCVSNHLHSLSLQICIQNNPEEARQMLLQNPQLSYALLQAQVVMKIVNPEIAQVCEWLKQNCLPESEQMLFLLHPNKHLKLCKLRKYFFMFFAGNFISSSRTTTAITT